MQSVQLTFSLQILDAYKHIYPELKPLIPILSCLGPRAQIKESHLVAILIQDII